MERVDFMEGSLFSPKLRDSWGLGWFVFQLVLFSALFFSQVFPKIQGMVGSTFERIDFERISFKKFTFREITFKRIIFV